MRVNALHEHLIGTWWVLPTVMTGVAIVGFVAWACVAWRRSVLADREHWVEVLPPSTVPPGGAGKLWQQLSLAFRSGSLVRARMIGWEIHADSRGVRTGFRLPHDVSAELLTGIITRSWPGARTRTLPITKAPAARLNIKRSGMRMLPNDEWSPLCHIPPADRLGPKAQAGEPLQTVFEAIDMARERSDIEVGVQIMVRRARKARMRGAQRRQGGANRHGGDETWGRFFADEGRELLTDICDEFLPGKPLPSPDNRPMAAAGPLDHDRHRIVLSKLSAAPHFEVCVRVVVSGGASREQRRLVLSSIASAYGLVTVNAPLPVELRRRPWLWPRAGWERRPWFEHGFVACLPELAALSGLPPRPAEAGLPTAGSRRVAPPRELFDGKGA